MPGEGENVIRYAVNGRGEWRVPPRVKKRADPHRPLVVWLAVAAAPFSATSAGPAGCIDASIQTSVDRAGRAALLQLDRAVDLERKRNSANCDRGLGWQRLAVLESAARHRIAHRLLDLALGGDTELLE